jgi:hypothetical protein
LSSISYNSLFESADLISLLHSLHIFDCVAKNPILSFLGLFSNRYVINNLNSCDRVLIVKGLGQWLQSELSQSNMNQSPSNGNLLHPPCHPTLRRYCELYLLIVSQLISWESLGSLRSVSSLTCYDTMIGVSEGHQEDCRFRYSTKLFHSIQNNDHRGWHLRHRVGWLKNPSPNHPFSSPSFFPSVSSFLNQFALKALDGSFSSLLFVDNSTETLRSSSPKTYEMIVFLHSISAIQPSVSFSQLDPLLFRSILSSLRMDLFPQLTHEMVHVSLLLLTSSAMNDEYSKLLEWLCTSPSSKRKTGDTPSKSSKRVRCEVSPSRVSSSPAAENETSENHFLKVSPKKQVFHSPPKKTMAPPHPSTLMKYVSPSRSEISNGIAFTSPGKDEIFRVPEGNGWSLTLSESPHFRCLRNAFASDLLERIFHEKSLSTGE